MNAKALFALAVVSAALVGCTKTSTNGAGGGAHSWTQPGVFRFSEAADPKNLNPVLDAATPMLDLSMFIYSWAIRYDAKGRPVPDALREVPTVANGDVSKDGLTLKYKLRPNIKWQDGAPLTCNDLKFTWQVVMNAHNNVTTTDGYKSIGSIDCSDRTVAVIHMKKLYAPYLQQLWGVNANAPILPAHILAKYNDDRGSFNTAPYNSLPVGSGPFKVVAWNRGQDVRMVANPYFYLGKPKLSEVVYKILPDENTMQTQLQTHEIDMLAIGSGMKWPQYAALADDPANGLVAVRVNSFLFSHLDFNLRHPIVSDRNVRVALAYATDRGEIINKILHGSAIPAETDQSPQLSWAYTSDITHHAYDPAKARAILDADGWKVGPGGIRVKDGQRLEFTLSTQTESNYGKALQTVLQRQWREVGAQADIKNYPASQFFDNSANGILQGGHYDVAGFSWAAASDPDDSAIYSADNFAPHGQNSMFWDNRTATSAMNDALSTIDQTRRKRDYVIVQQQLTYDVPTIIINFARVPYVYNNDLKGFDPSPVISAFWDPWNYSI
ncbi:MAG: peptide ABC transporter substrate-binding protein [Candidatus Eremiobacteraeota bacterium]|nr:peptide ABC transporter substrate-binding protein [Candidatus Eremiobacteraeota bacterium]MBV8497981.1 peptide ABC transporter substrate-binding protein [Candidatus Eremiobacteraeota bacterium]